MIRCTAARYHRNGVMGAGFYVVRFTYRERGEPVRQLQAVVFDEPSHVAVTSADHRETWRGDVFERELRAWIETEQCQAQAFAA